MAERKSWNCNSVDWTASTVDSGKSVSNDEQRVMNGQVVAVATAPTAGTGTREEERATDGYLGIPLGSCQTARSRVTLVIRARPAVTHDQRRLTTGQF